MQWKLKRQSNDELRQRFADQTVSQADCLRLQVPDPDLRWSATTDHYDFGAIDWDEFQGVASGDVPCDRSAQP